LGFVFHPVNKVTAVLVKVGDANMERQHIADKGFGGETHYLIRYHQADTTNIELTETVLAQKPQPRFMQQRHHAVVANMVAIIDFGYPHIQTGTEGKFIGQFEGYTGHNRYLLTG